MTALERVDSYLQRLRVRLRLFAASRGFAIAAVLALILTVALVEISARFQFAPGIVWPLRALLFAAVAGTVSFALAIPVLKLTKPRVTRIAERSMPALGERLLTVAEQRDPANAFTELVAEDVMRIAQDNPAASLGSARLTPVFAVAGAAALGVLVWLIAAGPGYWGYGASLLWTGSAHANQRPLYEVAVQPGNKTIRRKSDQAIKAQLIGFSARRVMLHARYGSSSKWQEAAMQPATQGNDYQFLFPAISDEVEYYVQADGARSKRFRISVKDLPAVKRVRVQVRFPSGLGLQDVSEDPGGDIRAVEGSRATVSVLTDRPLEHGVLVLDKGQKVELAKADGDWLKTEIPITHDGSYYIAAIDEGETIRISGDYFIEAKKDEPPTVRIVRPGRDPRVSPIEEVPVAVEAADDFGVKSLDLHYSVNGGAEQIARFKSQGTKDEKGHTTLYLENFKLAPGDVISMYGTATDANKTARSDILFAQAEAFDYKFSQSQQAGGMGAGGQQDSNISERQKQIIAATFNELRGESKSKSSLQEQAKFLADTEGKLGAQAQTLAERMGNRELSQANPEFEKFSKLMVFASSEMTDAVKQLAPAKWTDALVPEQKALQSLLRAEAIFRDIQVAFGQQGGMGGGSSAQLARMLDLELDTSKNQYETGQTQGDLASKQQKAIDDAFERLQTLARRQQELAQQGNQQEPAEQRWQEEQLRREAEELRRQMEELAKNSQGEGEGSQQSDSASARQSSQSGRQGTASAAQRGQRNEQNRQMTEAMRQASDALAQAEDEMRKAVSTGDNAAQHRAAGQLAQAQRQLSSALHRSAGNSLSDLSGQADSIASAQHDLADRIKQMYGRHAGTHGTDELSSILGSESGEMPEMNDPDNPRFGYGYRRRNWQQEMRPLHRPSEGEEALARDKEQLAQRLEQLQRGMQQEEQNLQGSAPDASNKLQKALSDAEQKELALRMQKNAQWIREGYGDRNLDMEDNVTAGVEQLSHDLRGAQQMLESGGQGGLSGQSEKTAEALAQVRQLREQLERAQQDRQGQQSGTGGQAGGRPQSGGQQDGRTGSLLGGSGGQVDRRNLQQTIGQLSALRGQISGEDRALGNYLGGTLGYLRDLNADPQVLQATISQDAVASLERLEAELSRRLGEQQGPGARSGAAELPAEKYRDAVADYFRKLSQPAQGAKSVPAAEPR